MDRIDAHNVKRGALLDALRLGHPTFIASRLAFGLYWSVERKEVARAYRDWLGVEAHAPADVGNLYALLVYLGAVHDEATQTFYGVELRGESEEERGVRGEGRGGRRFERGRVKV